jgi:hypothetical protein
LLLIAGGVLSSFAPRYRASQFRRSCAHLVSLSLVRLFTAQDLLAYLTAPRCRLLSKAIDLNLNGKLASLLIHYNPNSVARP